MANKHGGKRAGAGRPPVPRAPGEKLIETTITLPQNYIDYLRTLNPKNISAAIRDVIDEVRQED